MKTKAIIRQIARKNGVTPTEVEADIRFAMQEAMKSTDPIARAHWKKISPDGEEPTIERFLTYIIEQVRSSETS